MANTELVVKDLTLSEAQELRDHLVSWAAVTPEVKKDEIKYQIRTEYTTPTGLSSPIPPELVVVFVKGLVTGIGSGVGKLAFDKVRSWLSARRKRAALTLDGDAIEQE